MTCQIDDGTDTFSESGRARDQNDRAGDQTQKEPFRRLPGHEYASNYPDPITGDPLQIYPSKVPSDFDSEDDFWKYLDALSRRNNGLPPPRPKPAGNEISPRAAVRPGTMARMLVVRGVRASAAE